MTDVRMPVMVVVLVMGVMIGDGSEDGGGGDSNESKDGVKGIGMELMTVVVLLVMRVM